MRKYPSLKPGRQRKAQISSISLMVSTVIFLLLFYALEVQWDALNRQAQQASVQAKALRAAESLVAGAGYPADWNSSTAKKIGLAEERGVLDSGKMKNFFAMNYSAARTLLGTGKSDFHLNVSYLNGSIVRLNSSLNASMGQLPSNSSTIASPMKRAAVYSGQVVRLGIIVYE